MEIVLVAVLGMVTSIAVAIVAPLLLANRTAALRREERGEEIEQRKIEKEEERAERDEVAARAAEAATEVAKVADKAAEAAALVVENQDELKKQADEVARLAAETNAATTIKLDALSVVADQTHLLVNSNMMKEMRKGLVSLKAQLVSNERVLELSEKLGVDVSPDDLSVNDALKVEIASSEKALADLEKRTEEAALIAETGARETEKDAAEVKSDAAIEASGDDH